MFFIIYSILFCFFVYGFSVYVFKKTKYGFYLVMGEFGAGKTQNITAYLKAFLSRRFYVNIANYYTAYNHFQVSSHQDLVHILNDIYNYHLYINLYDDREELHTFKPDIMLDDYEREAKIFRNKYPDIKKNIKFTIALDEASIYFNPRNFKKNFSGENERLLDFIYQPRKLNLLMFVVVQSPMELDVKFRRLATYFRKFYKGFGFWRWYRDFYFLNPEEIDLEKAEQVGGGIIMGMNLNFYNKAPLFKYLSYPNYKYNTKELIRPGTDIYTPESLHLHLQKISKEDTIRKNTPLKQRIKNALNKKI